MATQKQLFLVIQMFIFSFIVGCQQPTSDQGSPWLEFSNQGKIFFFPAPSTPENSVLFVWWDDRPEPYELPVTIIDSVWHYPFGENSEAVKKIHRYRIQEDQRVEDSLGTPYIRYFFSGWEYIELEVSDFGFIESKEIVAPSLSYDPS